jgi:hypothetical protein
MSAFARLDVCRFHGARGGAPEGERNGNYRHGVRTKETVSFGSSLNRCADVRFRE